MTRHLIAPAAMHAVALSPVIVLILAAILTGAFVLLVRRS